MLVASTPETTNPVSDQCELNEVPCVSTIAPWQPWFFGRGGDPAKGFNWTYHFFWGLEDVIAVFTNLWKSVPTNQGRRRSVPQRRRRQRVGRSQGRLPRPAQAERLHTGGPGSLSESHRGFQRADRGVQTSQSGDPHRRGDSARLQDVLDAVRAAGLQAQGRSRSARRCCSPPRSRPWAIWVMAFPPKSGGVPAIRSNLL